MSLRRRAEFARLRQRGKRTATRHLTIYRLSSGLGEPAAAGISVPLSVGKAVVRNKVRRRIGAALHELLEGRNPRLLVIARPSAASAQYRTLYEELSGALG